MKIDNIRDLFASQIMNLYDAEQRLVKLSPKWRRLPFQPNCAQRSNPT